MQLKNIRLAATSVALSALLCISHVSAFAVEDKTSKSYIIKTDQDMSVSDSLQIIHPSKDISTASKNYFITGSSNPDAKLYCNGEEVTYRGIYGSFGTYVSLEEGKNVFTLKNSGVTKTITITRVSSQGQVPTAKATTISSMTPAYDEAVEAGTKMGLKCVAPAGASVWATVGGKTVNLKQVAIASDGVPAVFRGEVTVPSKGSDVTAKIGKVEYGMKYNGNTQTKTSGGTVYSVGADTRLVVEVLQEGAVTFKEGNTNSGYVTVQRVGSTDYVVDSNDTMYKLSMGGWIMKDAVQPIEGDPSYKIRVEDVSYREDKKSEEFILDTNGLPSFKASHTSDAVTIKLYNTRGIDSVPTKKSELISSADVSYGNGDTTITFNIEDGEKVWGYHVYQEDGETILQLRYPPESGSSEKPLKGVTVAIDPGHGGVDSGALGVQWLSGPTEAKINLASAQVLQKKLEAMGAEVVMTRTDDTYLTLDERMKIGAENKADFFLSLHCNSIGLLRNSNESYGSEIYYYQPISKILANNVLNSMANNTNISKRKVMQSYYRVTLNSYAPSMLIEMGFMTNPKDYDQLISPSGRYNTAVAISDALVDYIRNY